MAKAHAIHVVATMNLTRATGHIQHVTPVPALPPNQRVLASGRSRRAAASSSAAMPQAALRLIGGRDRILGEYAAGIIPDACLNPGDDVTGMVDAFLPAGEAARLELVLNGQVIDTFAASGTARPVSNIRAERLRRRAERTAEAVEADPVISWSPAGGRRAARAGARETGPRYTVQVSVDGGETWQTVGYGLRDPRVTLDREILGDAETVRVRITSTTGFRSASTEKELKTAELG